MFHYFAHLHRHVPICPSRCRSRQSVEWLKPMSTQPRCQTTSPTLYVNLLFNCTLERHVGALIYPLHSRINFINRWLLSTFYSIMPWSHTILATPIDNHCIMPARDQRWISDLTRSKTSLESKGSWIDSSRSAGSAAREVNTECTVGAAFSSCDDINQNSSKDLQTSNFQL